MLYEHAHLTHVTVCSALDPMAPVVLGGLVTVIAGLLAKAFGPVFGGLFLAFPAIVPASVTLIAKRERQTKARHGLDGMVRGGQAAALDAAGIVLGVVGLGCFAGSVLTQAIQTCASETSAKKLNIQLDLQADNDLVNADPARLTSCAMRSSSPPRPDIRPMISPYPRSQWLVWLRWSAGARAQP
jgi:hypothetical protein